MQEINEENLTFLTFRLSSDLFATPVGKVIEIIDGAEITKLPQSPEFVKGIINVRNTPIPVLDLSMKFGFTSIEQTEKSGILIFNIHHQDQEILLGAFVDEVIEVKEITEKEISPIPPMGIKYKAQYLKGLINNANKYTVILDIDKVLTTEEIDILEHSNTTDLVETISEEQNHSDSPKKNKRK